MQTFATDIWGPIADVARFAPTPHNTQPFRLRPRDARSADVVMLGDRLLPAEDRGNLYLAATAGIFAETLERGAGAIGIEAHVSPAAEVVPAVLHRAPETVVGHVELGAVRRESAETLFALREGRRTSRLPYDGRAVPPHVIARQKEIARAAGHELVVVDDAPTVNEVLSWNATAVAETLERDDERRELARWYRTGCTPKHGDGLWNRPLAQPSWEVKAAFSAPWLFRPKPLRKLAERRYLASQSGTPQIGVLRGAFSTWHELFGAGRMLMRSWMALTEDDVRIHPLGSLLTSPKWAATIEARFGANVWLVFRMGFSPMPEQAPRLPSILLEEELAAAAE